MVRWSDAHKTESNGMTVNWLPKRSCLTIKKWQNRERISTGMLIIKAFLTSVFILSIAWLVVVAMIILGPVQR